ncbi:hypothetical protein [Pseudolactococcus insecticola]|uniref:Uncharacterized protein n=1 Tax=Pseudolactococcus insecticola TaxID=2709158 RepID=A0A6A0B4M4_9LACT|nr:hypothetical protein [Lactococcus insecticola]GFH40310.1 hypothetical protein Hs20B_07080 [Lactococcus insecticola]
MIKKELLTSTIWAYGRPFARTFSENVRFTADGKIENSTSSNLSFWTIADEALLIYDNNHQLKMTLVETTPGRFEGKMGINPRFLKVNNLKHAARLDEMLLDEQVENDSLRSERKTAHAIIQKLNFKMTKLSEGKVKVAFLLHKYGSVVAMRDLMLRLQVDERFELKVYTVPWVIPNGANILPKLNDELKAAGIAFETGEPDELAQSLKTFLPHFIFRQDPWEDGWHKVFSAPSLSYAKLNSIFYTVIDNFISDDTAQWMDPATNTSPYYLYGNVIYGTLSQNEKDNYEKAGRQDIADKYHDVGNIKAVSIAQTEAYWPEEMRDFKKKIVIVAHFTIEDKGLQFGVLGQFFDKYLALIEKYPDYAFILNPHPEFQTHNPQKYREFVQKWEALPNARVVADRGMHALVKAADLVIADGVSILYESQILRTPIVWLEREGHKKLSQDGEALMDGVHRLTQFDRLEAEMQEILTNGDTLLENQIANTAKWLHQAQPEKQIVEELFSDVFETL